MITNEERNSATAWLLDAIDEDINALPIQAGEFGSLDWALIYEATPLRIRERVWSLIPNQLKSAVLADMRQDVRRQTLHSLPPDAITELAKHSSSDEIIEFYDLLPVKIARGIVKKLSPENKSQLHSALSYDDDQLGRYVTHDALVVQSNALIADVILDLKNLEEKYYTDKIYVINGDDVLVGSFDMHQLALHPPKTPISSIVDTDIDSLLADIDPLDAVDALKSSEENHLPVIDQYHHLLGVFGQVDAFWLAQKNFEEQLSHIGNVGDEDLFSPVVKSASSRAIWLGINLITAVIAAGVIGLFEEVISKVVALAVLMPIVASMGGIAGSQTLTLTIRGLATGQLNSSNTHALGQKEISVSLINGILWALVVGLICSAWYNDLSLSLIIAVAILANMMVAVLAGVVIPIMLDRMGVDPALAGSVILTTVSDVVGFFVFLGTAAWLLG